MKGSLGALALVAVLAACTAQGGSPTAAVATTEASSEVASLTVAQSYDPGPRGTLFIEGALGEVFLVDTQGGQQVTQAPITSVITFSGLKPGRYVIRAGLRPCSANCGNLSPRTGACQTTAEMTGRSALRVTYTADGPCTVVRI